METDSRRSPTRFWNSITDTSWQAPSSASAAVSPATLLQRASHLGLMRAVSDRLAEKDATAAAASRALVEL